MPLEFIKREKSAREKAHDGERMLLDRFRGPMAERSHWTLHVSDLTNEETKFCAREFALMDAAKIRNRTRAVFPAMRVAFEVGKMYEDLVRNRWLADHAVGGWVCEVCGSSDYKFSKLPRVPCDSCHFQRWTYQEVAFVHEKSKASGSPDLLLDIGQGKHVIYELKTIDKDEFRMLKMPYAEHRIRTQCYMRLAQQSQYKNRINTENARILYLCKGFGMKSEKHGQISPFREFMVEANPSMADAYLADGVPLAKWRDGGEMPDRICANMFVQRSQRCKLHGECWSKQYPPGMKNADPITK